MDQVMGADEKPGLGMKVRTDLDYDEAVTRTRELLAEQGFGILTEIDVKSTLKTKINADFRRYVILGACNPALAHRALTKEIDVGLVLPCNVIVYENDGGGSTVNFLNPMVAMGLGAGFDLEELASEAQQRLIAVSEALPRS